MMNPTSNPYLWKTSLQCTLPHRDAMKEFTQLLLLLRDEGFHGIELNLPRLDIIAPGELTDLLRHYNLSLDMLATGAFARHHRLSLTDPDPDRRDRAICACRENIAYASTAGCGIILGFFKGGPGQDSEARSRLIDSLRQLSGFILELGTPVLLEATNHNESSTACSLDDTLEILNEVACPNIKLLADTYHINLEEPPLTLALRAYMNRFPRLHISDNNRAFPGLGSLDFYSIYGCLAQWGFDGALAIEGNLQDSQIEDTRRCAAYLREVCSHLRAHEDKPALKHKQARAATIL